MPEARSVEDKSTALALIAAGATQSHAARLAGLPQTTIADWAKGKGLGDQKDAIEATTEQFRERFEDIILRALGAVDSSKLERANFAQIMTGVGIAIDKRQLLLGRPTQIIETKRDVEQIKSAFSAAFQESALQLSEFLQFCVDQAELEGDHELAKLLPQIIEIG